MKIIIIGHSTGDYHKRCLRKAGAHCCMRSCSTPAPYSTKLKSLEHPLSLFSALGDVLPLDDNLEVPVVLVVLPQIYPPYDLIPHLAVDSAGEVERTLLPVGLRRHRTSAEHAGTVALVVKVGVKPVEEPDDFRVL